jgi:predicted PurR-regulated permease PerM
VDFIGNISLRLIGALGTIAVLVAVYFFVIKPTTDTANNAISSISEPLKETQREVAQAQQQLQQGAQSGGTGSQTDLNQLNKLQKCVHKAHQDVNLLQRCAERFGP